MVAHHGVALRPGEIYWINVDGGRAKLVLIISRQSYNHGDRCVAVDFTTKRLAERSKSPSCVSSKPLKPICLKIAWRRARRSGSSTKTNSISIKG